MAVLAMRGAAHAVPLSNLLAGSSISVGDCLFTDWQLLSLDATGTPPNLSLVSVNPLDNDLGAPGLQFVGNNQLAATNLNGLDLVVRYRAQVLPAGNALVGHTLTITNLTFAGGGGVGFVSDGMSTPWGTNFESAVAIGDPANGVFQLADAAEFSSQSGVLVTTNIFLQGLAAGHSINLGSFNQRFLQTGSPVLEGDYNQNGVVDAADYTVWRNAVGSPAGTLPNDTSGAVIGSGQYATWKSNFGLMGGGSVAPTASTTVPEPGSLLLSGAAILAGLPLCRSRRGA